MTGGRADLRENYDAYYADGDEREWRRLGAIDKAANIVRLCSGLRPRTVLEIGAGDGAILARLSELGFAECLYAAEISSSGVEAIRGRGIAGLKEVVRFDGATLPYETGAFDLVILSHVVEHLEFPRQLLYEAARVAQYVFIEVPLEDTRRHPSDLIVDRVGHINHYSPRTIRWLAQSSRLRVLGEIVTNPSRPVYAYGGRRGAILDFYIKELLLRVAPSLATRWFCYHGSLLCEPVHAVPPIATGNDAGTEPRR